MRDEEQLDAILERLEILQITIDVLKEKNQELRDKLDVLEEMVKE